MSAQGSPARKLTTLTLAQKGKVIDAIESGDRKTDVAEKFGISKATVTRKRKPCNLRPKKYSVCCYE